MKNILIIFLLIGFGLAAQCQEIPPERLTPWSLVGTHFEPNLPTEILNVIDFGADSSGVVSCDAALQMAMNEGLSLGGAVLFFPRGKYFFQQSLQLPSNICLRGESAELTILCFATGEQHAILVQGAITNIQANLTATATRHDSLIWVDDATNFAAGDMVYVVDVDTVLVTSDWALGYTGQYAYIQSTSNQSITLNSPLRRTMNIALGATIRKIAPVENVSIEQLTIFRLDSTAAQRSNIYMNYTTQCQVRCVKSYNANFSHITLNSSCNVQVEGCYFQDAMGYGNGGQGYGVVLQFGASENLVYNNIFKHLRHSMLLQAGPNGNVLAYNYSIDPFWTDVGLPSYSAGDLVLHGNYPYCNLMEGNTVQNIVIDDSHGKNGPYNTFLRNRAELYGIFMNNAPPSNSQHFVSNEITNDSSSFGFYFINGTDHFSYGNVVKGVVKPSGTMLSTPFSYFLAAPLPYYDSLGLWPPIGNIALYNTLDIEAKTRYENGVLTACSLWDVSTKMEEYNIENAGKPIVLFPVPAQHHITFQSAVEMESILMTGAFGNLWLSLENLDQKEYKMPIEQLPSGAFYLRIVQKGTSKPILIKGLKL